MSRFLRADSICTIKGLEPMDALSVFLVMYLEKEKNIHAGLFVWVCSHSYFQFAENFLMVTAARMLVPSMAADL